MSIKTPTAGPPEPQLRLALGLDATPKIPRLPQNQAEITGYADSALSTDFCVVMDWVAERQSVPDKCGFAQQWGAK